MIHTPASCTPGVPYPLTIPDSRELWEQTCGEQETYGHHWGWGWGAPGKQARNAPACRGHHDLSHQEDPGQDVSPPPTCFLLLREDLSRHLPGVTQEVDTALPPFANEESEPERWSPLLKSYSQ